MAQAVAGHAFGELNLHALVAFTREQNAASQRVMVKVGFVYESEFTDDGARQVLYRLRPATLRP